jgi:predicted class III extradiol MEMO1 family dioxygenase
MLHFIRHITLILIFAFSFNNAKSQNIESQIFEDFDFAFLFKNVEKSIKRDAKIIVIPNSEQYFSGFDAAQAYSYIDKNKNYKNIYFVYSSKTEKSKMFEKHINIIKTWIGNEIKITPIYINSNEINLKKIEEIRSNINKNNLLIISDDIVNQIDKIKSYSQTQIPNKSNSIWTILY